MRYKDTDEMLQRLISTYEEGLLSDEGIEYLCELLIEKYNELSNNNGKL